MLGIPSQHRCTEISLAWTPEIWSLKLKEERMLGRRMRWGDEEAPSCHPTASQPLARLPCDYGQSPSLSALGPHLHRTSVWIGSELVNCSTGRPPRWLRAVGGRWAFVGAGWARVLAFVPARAGGLGEAGVFCARGAFLCPCVQTGGGAVAAAPHLSSPAADGPQPPPLRPQQAACPFVLEASEVLTIVRVPSLNKFSAALSPGPRKLASTLQQPQGSRI